MQKPFFGDFPASRNISVLIVVFGVFLLAFIWISLFYKVQSERELEIENACKQTANFARAFEEHTLRTIKYADQVALFLKYEYEHAGQRLDIPLHIQEGRLEINTFVLLSVADENGDLAASSQVPFVPSNIADREHFLVHKAADIGRLFISKPMLGRSSGKWSIQMTRRINKPGGSFGGVAVVSVDPSYFTKFYSQVNLGQNSLITLVGRDGVVRARQVNQNAEAPQDLTNTPLMKHLASGEDAASFIFISPFDGIKRIYSYRALPDYPFVVVVGLDEAEVLQDFNERVAGYLTITTTVSVAILIFIFLLLRATAQQRRAKKALRQARDNLEDEVKQRTQELFAANTALTAVNDEHVAMNEEFQHTNAELNREVAERIRTAEELKKTNSALAKAYSELKAAQAQVIQQEKMASVGQLAAGVAHEINNPIAFTISNLESLQGYRDRIAQFITIQNEALADLATGQEQTLVLDRLAVARQSQKIDYILSDIDDLVKDSLEGANRVKNIVQALRGFARMETDYRLANIHEGIDSTINIIWSELKHTATLEKDFGDIPLTKCNLGQLNQVFMNILMNAAQAIDGRGTIRIKTWAAAGSIYVSITDTGSGITPKVINKIFEPFFTTKEVGKGTGLGLSVTYDIIKNHGGKILVESQVGQGTTFTVVIPIVE